MTPAGDRFFATVSAERFDLVDADALVWIAATQTEIDALRSDPAHRAQRAVQQSRDVFPPYDPLGTALSCNDVLGLPFAIDRMVPLLQAAVAPPPGRPPLARVLSRRRPRRTRARGPRRA